jgi:hypothetical protein
MTKARCQHGAPWFVNCPWCVDPRESCRPRQVVYAFPCYVKLTEEAMVYLEDAVNALVRRERLIASVQGLMQRAIDELP